MTIRDQLQHTWTVVGELTSRLCIFVPEPPERTGIRPADTRYDIGTAYSSGMREHG